MEINWHFIKGKIEEGVIEIKYTPTQQQTVDILTKAIWRMQFDNLLYKLGVKQFCDNQVVIQIARTQSIITGLSMWRLTLSQGEIRGKSCRGKVYSCTTANCGHLNESHSKKAIW